MIGQDLFTSILQMAGHEILLFAAIGLLIGGLDDLAIDLIWITRLIWRRLFVYSRYPRATAASLAEPGKPGHIAVFIGAWDEGPVIGAMLRAALDRYDHDDYRIYVGVYPNDPATQATVGAIAAIDDRVKMVGGLLAGPTTKAECLNRLWTALLADEAYAGRHAKAVLLHDAEDVVHPSELRVIDSLIERFDLVQLPVMPLPDPSSCWVAGHYCDEFAEAHGKQLVVREALGAGVPLAGVGCGIARAALAKLAALNGGVPFDAASLTEDYEMGLRLARLGSRCAFVRLRSAPDRPLVMVRAHFPGTLDAAVRQKTRWMIGIALAGWDRLGWRGGIAESWMRLRDRRGILAALILFAAYLSLLLWALGWAMDAPIETNGWFDRLLLANGALLCWRLAMRMLVVGHFYGWREGFRSAPRLLVGNIIAMIAARRAVFAYAAGNTRWDKTRHIFPSVLPVD